jgi:hypothetical protein
MKMCPNIDFELGFGFLVCNSPPSAFSSLSSSPLHCCHSFSSRSPPSLLQSASKSGQQRPLMGQWLKKGRNNNINIGSPRMEEYSTERARVGVPLCRLWRSAKLVESVKGSRGERLLLACPSCRSYAVSLGESAHLRWLFLCPSPT